MARSKSSLLDTGASDPGISAYDMMTMPQSTTDSYKRGRQNAAFVSNHESVPSSNSSGSTQHYGDAGHNSRHSANDRVDHTRGSYDVTKPQGSRSYFHSHDSDSGIPIGPDYPPMSPQPPPNMSQG